MLVENRNYLRRKNRALLNKLNAGVDINGIEILAAKNGVPTLTILENDVMQFIHSSYDPIKEVNSLIKKYQSILKEGDSIIFLGLGLGYHIPEFIDKFKPESITLIEFNPSILKKFLEYNNLKDNSFKNMTNIYMTDENLQIEKILNKELQKISPVKIVVLPSYERIYKCKVKEINQIFKELLLTQKDRFNTNITFQNRWIFNSLMNIPNVIKTPNFMHDIDPIFFKDKPAIIVSAGPSLNYEIEQLKHIKKSKSAYIFSIGSAINSLIEHDIYPDAAFTYDPTERNQYVFEKLKKQNIMNIPLIYGSSVGFETLINFPGKMFHFLTNQDTVSAKILVRNESGSIETIDDAPSIAVLALRVLTKIGCDPIVFVGQNLSFTNERYAKGIDYNWIDNQLSQEELDNTFEVESVNGGVVRTSNLMIKMKKSLESHLKINSNTKFYNTTIEGAKIEYTEYIELQELTKTFRVNIIDLNWIENSISNYDLKGIQKKYMNLYNEQGIVEVELNKIKIILEDLNKSKSVRYNEKQLDLCFVSIDKHIDNIEVTDFYKVFLASMSRHEIEIISSKIRTALNIKRVWIKQTA